MKRVVVSHAHVYQSVLLAFGVIFSFVVAGGYVRVEAQQPQCGSGEVQSTLQALPVGFVNVNNMNSSVKIAGLGGGVDRCQYRLYFDGQIATFHASDFILGGVSWTDPYVQSGHSREEAIDEIQKIEDRVFLLRQDSSEPPIEQQLMHTAFKDMLHPSLGHIVYQSRGYITQLEPGIYESLWISTVDGVEVDRATVTLEILP